MILLGWLKVRELAFSKVEEDADGILNLSRSVVLDENMGWHAQVGVTICIGPSRMVGCA